MANENQFKTAPVKVLNRSAFDKSHKNFLTGKVGTLVPVLVDEVIPDSTIDLRAAAIAKMPPLATETYMNVRMNMEAFFVPYRILYGGFQFAVTNQNVGLATYNYDSLTSLPYLLADCNSFTGNVDNAGDGSNMQGSWIGPGTLADYLGVKMNRLPDSTDWRVRLNIFPFLAYHMIYDQYYRPKLLQRPAFLPQAGSTGSVGVTTMPYSTSLDTSMDPSGHVANNLYRLSANAQCRFNDGFYIGSLRKRHFGSDYFSSATPSPSVGNVPAFQISGTVSGETATSSFTIGALRAVNSLTQFAERNALAGVDYNDWLRANYGTSLSSEVVNRPSYLGRLQFDVYTNGVSQTVGSDEGTNNPFSSVGTTYGSASASGEGSFVENFVVREPGVIMVLASLTPRPSYSTGISRYLRHFTEDGWRADLANQIFENVGPQPIYVNELNSISANPDSVFGYTDRYAEYKTKFDEIHGYLRDGQNISSFALQRSFASDPAIGVNFTEILDGYLDSIYAQASLGHPFDYWMDIFFNYKVVQPLSRYSQPSLVMPAELNGHYVDITRAGYHY